MPEQQNLIRLNLSRFQTWLRQGIISIERVEIVKLPIEVNFNRYEQKVEFYIQMPQKYDKPFKKGSPVFALIDECDIISLASLELTEEWRIRMQNLNEGWLPFNHQPEWFKQRTLTIGDVNQSVPSVSNKKPRNKRKKPVTQMEIPNLSSKE